MESVEKKEKFIALRGEGKSIRATCKELNINPSTGNEWEKKLKERVETERAERLNELHQYYGMVKEKRIKRIGDTLNKITEAIGNIDFSTIAPEKLLDLQLKYVEALQREYNPPRAKIEASDPKQALIKVLADTADKVRCGELNPEQAKNETQAISNLLQALDISDKGQPFNIVVADERAKQAIIDL